MKRLTFASVLLVAAVSLAGDFKSDFTTGTAGKVEAEGERKKEEGGSAERKFPLKPEEMQAAVQKFYLCHLHRLHLRRLRDGDRKALGSATRHLPRNRYPHALCEP